MKYIDEKKVEKNKTEHLKKKTIKYSFIFK